MNRRKDEFSEGRVPRVQMSRSAGVGLTGITPHASGSSGLNLRTAVVYPQMAQIPQMKRLLEASKPDWQAHPAGDDDSARNGLVICAICAICGLHFGFQGEESAMT